MKVLPPSRNRETAPPASKQESRQRAEQQLPLQPQKRLETGSFPCCTSFLRAPSVSCCLSGRMQAFVPAGLVAQALSCAPAPLLCRRKRAKTQWYCWL